MRNLAIIVLSGASTLGSGCATTNTDDIKSNEINLRDSQVNSHLREVAYTHDPKYYEYFKSSSDPKPNGMDGGDNCLKEPAYVKTHFWTVPSPHKDEEGLTPWTVHIERDIFDKKYGGKNNSNVYGIENGIVKRRVEFDNQNTTFDPRESQIGLEEYIRIDNNPVRIDNGNSLGVLVLDESVFYRFYDKEGFTTYEKSGLDSDPKVLNDEQKKLYDLVVLNDRDLNWIVSLRKSKGKLNN